MLLVRVLVLFDTFYMYCHLVTKPFLCLGCQGCCTAGLLHFEASRRHHSCSCKRSICLSSLTSVHRALLPALLPPLLLLLCRSAPGGAAAGVSVLAQLYGATRVEARLARYLQVRGGIAPHSFKGVTQNNQQPYGATCVEVRLTRYLQLRVLKGS
jgi:hypothetical protein